MHLATASRFLRHTIPLKLSDFIYEYPKELIANYPAEPREEARLMVVDREAEAIEHRTLADLPDYFEEGDVLVANDSKVFPARLYGTKEKTGAKVEVFLLRELNPETRLWDVIVEPARKVRVGNKLFFSEGLAAEVIDNTTSRGRTLRFLFDDEPEALYALIERIGHTPLPRYIRREAEPEDKTRYQTLFAKHRGAVAAPAAGLHFTDALVDTLTAKGVDVTTVTLHTGLGTFRPVEVEDLTKHRMDSENFQISAEAATTVNRALTSRTNKVTVCSTTTVRAIESSLSADRNLKAGSGWTDKFIYPPHEFHITERLLTNFQMPRSTLLIMVAAFGGADLIRHAYNEAMKEEYRLFAFGDAMLIV
ncbi:MAG: tRNA preQ1(34) S-adenosylmethionine ribosyltransferase-isomerase QueA [Rhodothermaceae bacterium]|nr:tRNA preQ1(34) S-adenosylmethionine ribosyltransferase-isomerase QueA [Rhodothermaceae bacterium]